MMAIHVLARYSKDEVYETYVMKPDDISYLIYELLVPEDKKVAELVVQIEVKVLDVSVYRRVIPILKEKVDQKYMEYAIRLGDKVLRELKNIQYYLINYKSIGVMEVANSKTMLYSSLDSYLESLKPLVRLFGEQAIELEVAPYKFTEKLKDDVFTGNFIARNNWTDRK